MNNNNIEALVDEKLKYPSDFADVEESTLKNIFKNLHNSNKAITAKSQKWIKSFCLFMIYLDDIQRRLKGNYLTAPMLINFCKCLDALESYFDSRKDKGFLKKGKSQSLEHYLQNAMKDRLEVYGSSYKNLGAHMRKNIVVEDVDSQLHYPNDFKANQFFSVAHGSMAGEICARLQLDRPEAVQDYKIL